METFFQYGLIEWLQGLGNGLLPIMNFLSLLGTEIFYLFILPVLLWCYDIRFGLRVGAILLSSGSLNLVIKGIFGLPRPYWVNKTIRALGTDPYFGMPSGHAQNSTAMFGRMGTLVQKRWFQISVILLIFLISLSRLYLGVHFPRDIIVGWMFGMVLLLLFTRLESPFLEWYGARSKAFRIFFPVLLSFLIILPGFWVANLQEYPTTWAALAMAAAPDAAPIDPTSIEPFISGAGIFMGFCVGAVLLIEWGRFEAKGSPSQLFLRYVLGLVGVVILFAGLRAILPTGDSALALALRYLRYASVGLWITFLGPWLFVRTGLAGKKVF